ncbi:MAG: histidine kinase [Cytophagaceae bacterium]|nr:histidine kinase [Cytophagaceae bacterium]MBK9510879.1 histidine kinase [Cytophagaceae bacterium]MBK9934640.1 histidine kinase [Cytophagaceae bacterium]MBL0301078.1 histidine kinase [Cytophagaceae bacterium]MBL0323896.1 histidine kinase [Cytophagaceae bacterium]
MMHLSFWCLYFSFFFYQITFLRHREDFNLGRSFADAITNVFFMGIASYLNYFLWLPRFLKHKRFLQYLFEFLIPFAIIVFLHLTFKKWLYADLIQNGRNFFNSNRFVFQHIAAALFIVIFVGMLRFVEDWFTLEAKKKEVENEKLTSELRFLKAQINPHFLFNTLNNLYYLATINSPNTTEVIEKLSQMMRYMLYDSNHEEVPLSKELDYMQNYISLEKLRLDNQVPVDFEIMGNPESVTIVPLIFITFLENAFKHGVSNQYKDSFVNVFVKIEEKLIIYKVKNSILPNANKLEKSGIGLQNVSRRLELSYPGKYILEKNHTEEYYEVILKLIL